ncbi:MAG: hypothetical protein ACYS6W_18080 [Planctomycetota bacterium]
MLQGEKILQGRTVSSQAAAIPAVLAHLNKPPPGCYGLKVVFRRFSLIATGIETGRPFK